jgi:hypothetical protein
MAMNPRKSPRPAIDWKFAWLWRLEERKAEVVAFFWTALRALNALVRGRQGHETY